MTCEEARTLLDDYVDGELAEAQRQELDRHLEACGACRDEERRLRALVADARALTAALEPARDLWPAIEREIRRPGFASPGGAAFWTRPAALAAAAAVLVALSSTATFLLTRLGQPMPAVTLPALTLSPAAAGAEPEQLDAEREYQRAASDLVVAINARRDALAPETLRAVNENLRVIGDALAQLRAALRRDPGNRELTLMLSSAHRHRVDTLRRVLRLSQI